MDARQRSFQWLKSSSFAIVLLGGVLGSGLGLSSHASVANSGRSIQVGEQSGGTIAQSEVRSGVAHSGMSQSQIAQSQIAQSRRPAVRRPPRLPANVRLAVLRTHARQYNIPVGQLRVVSSSWETWPDTCLGLGRPEESCGAMMVNGWRLEVGHQSQRTFYRTDSTGSVVRLEDADNSGSLPRAVGQKVLEFAAKDLKVPVSQLKIADSRSRLWEGCLGVAEPETACTMIGIPGWQVVVTGPQQYAVYHLNKTVSMIKRNPTTSGSGTIVPGFWYPDPSMQLPAGGEMVFQSIQTGGIAGLSYKTVLRRDGTVLRIDLRSQPPKVPTIVRQLSQKEMQEFMQLLQRNEFGDFLGFNYPTSRGADYFTIALMGPGEQGVQYADIVQTETPPKLQQIIQAWNRIATPNR